ncbi:MAG: hypothetical protein HQ503_09265 [Rhodospirillales bacterium]|nr:hypothetical protein [Rhodospirillales bacterium]
MSQLSQLFEIYPGNPNATMPLGACANGVVYAGGLAGVDPVGGEVQGDLVSQTKAALGHLAAAVEGAGGSTDNIGRAVAFVTKPEDRMALYEPWDAMFPDDQDRPAFKVLVAPLPKGQLVRIDGFAVLGMKRVRGEIPGVPARDPTVRTGDWIFTSRVHGTIPGGDMSDDKIEETRQAFANIAELMRVNGAKPEDVVQITAFGRDASFISLAEKAYAEIFSGIKARPQLKCLISAIPDRLTVMAEAVGLIGSGDDNTAFEEIYLAPHANPAPAGLRLGDLIIAPGIKGDDPATGKLAVGAAAQMAAACTNMEAFAKAAGGDLGTIARAALYMRSLDDRPVLNEIWAKTYPDMSDRAPHKYAPAALPEGQDFRFMILGVLNAERTCLKIPGLHHGDPMSMGAKTGNLVTSSRIFGTHAHSGERAADEVEAADLVFEHIGTLLEQAGGGWDNLTQLTAFIGDPGFRGLIEDRFAKHAKKGAPRLNIIETTLAGGPNPRAEILALI